MRPFTPQRYLPPPPQGDNFPTAEGMRQSPDMRARIAQQRLDRAGGLYGQAPDLMHPKDGPYQKLLPGQSLGGANPVGGATIAPGNAMVNGQLKFVGSPDYGGTNGPTAQGKHIGSKPRRYGNADDYYADHSNLRDLHAENSVDPVTGMKVKPSSFDMESKRAELARNGEWDALARLNNYTRAQASGDPQAIGSAREDITNFRAIRQAKQQYGSGPADAGPYAPDTRAPGDFGGGGQANNPYSRDTRAPGDFGGGAGVMQEGNPYTRDTRAPGDFSGGAGVMQEGNPYTRDTRAPGDFGGGGQAPHQRLRNPHLRKSRDITPLSPSPTQAPPQDITRSLSPADLNRNDYAQQRADQLEEEAQSPASRAVGNLGRAGVSVFDKVQGLQKRLSDYTLPGMAFNAVRGIPRIQAGSWFRGDPEKRAEAQRLREQYR